MSVLEKAVRGVKWTGASSVFVSLLNVAQIAVLARFLDKSDFGLFATVSLVFGLGSFFVDAGLGAAVIHRQNSSKESLGSAYALNIFFGFVVFLTVFFLAPFLAYFYNDSRIETLVRVSSLGFLIQPFGLQYLSLLQRDMRFSEVAIIDLLAASFGAIFVFSFAFLGFGVWSLVLGQLFLICVRTSVFLFFGVRFYGFSVFFSFSELRYYLRFGGFQIGEGLLNYSNSQLDIFLVGKVLGQDVLGAYFVCKQLVYRPVQIINPILTKVALPAFSSLQGDAGKLRSAYLALINLVCSIHVVVYFFIASFSTFIVTFVLGGRWLDSAPIVSLMCIPVFLRAVGNPIGSLQLARGRVDLGFYWNLGMSLFTIMSIMIGSAWGVVGVLVAQSVVLLLAQYPAWRFLVFPLCGAGVLDYFRFQLFFIGLGVVCFISSFLLGDLFLKISTFFLGVMVYLVISFRILRGNFRL